MGNTVLITGFAPFGGEAVNPSWEAVRRLPDRIGDAQILKMEIPVAFGKAGIVLEKGMSQYSPDIVICVGQAGGRAEITPEKAAINYRDATIADNEGFRPADCPVLAGGPAAYFTTLPVRKMVQRMQDAGIPARVSYSAGTFVCNDLMYTLLHLTAAEDQGIRAGFIHVPYSEEQLAHLPSGTPGMSLTMMEKGLEECIRACIS